MQVKSNPHWHNLPSNAHYDRTEDDYKASKTTEDLFAIFIIYYNPNGANVPDWVKPGEKNLDMMDINVDSKAVKAIDGNQFELFEMSFIVRKNDVF